MTARVPDSASCDVSECVVPHSWQGRRKARRPPIRIAKKSVTVRKVFSIVSILAVLAVVLQFYFAGVGHFSIPEDGLFGIHGNVGASCCPCCSSSP